MPQGQCSAIIWPALALTVVSAFLARAAESTRLICAAARFLSVRATAKWTAWCQSESNHRVDHKISLRGPVRQLQSPDGNVRLDLRPVISSCQEISLDFERPPRAVQIFQHAGIAPGSGLECPYSPHAQMWTRVHVNIPSGLLNAPLESVARTERGQPCRLTSRSPYKNY